MSTTEPISLLVKVIAHDSLGRVLLRRARTSRGVPGRWEFPGGKVGCGKSFDVALIRELRAETGLTIALKGSFGTCECIESGNKTVYLVMEGAVHHPKVRPDAKRRAFEWVAPDQFGELEFAPQFRRIARRYAQEVAINPRVAPAKKQQGPEDLFKGSLVNPKNLKTHIKAFEVAASERAALSKSLKQFLGIEVKRQFPLADVDARSKELASFAGKLINKNKYRDPLRQVTDLIGARIVVHLPSEVEAVGKWIETVFRVDRANSVDKLKELGADRFGYRSVHYVVELRDNQPPGLPVPFGLAGIKAEIQIRTIAQHAWSDIGHDRVYKADCDIPDYWKREANRIAALLEAADEEFARLVKGVDAYRNQVGSCLDCRTARRRLQLWETVRALAPHDPAVALRVVHLAGELEDWGRIVAVAEESGEQSTVELLCARGCALCRKAAHPHSREWKDGIAILTEAAVDNPDILEPRLRLGELLTLQDRAKALEYYSQAFQLDSGDPAVLAGYVRCKVLEERTTAFLPLLRPDIEEAIRRCQDLVAAGADVPHAFYRNAGFLFLLGPDRGQEGLEMLARAVHETHYPDIIIRALQDVSALAGLLAERVDIKCAVRLLTAALWARFPTEPWPEDVPVPVTEPLDTPRPVIIVAGGCHARHEATMKTYGKCLSTALGAYRGTIISGGTEQGISGLVGTLTAKAKGRIHSVGYLPENLPSDKSASRDARYVEIRDTDGETGFTALEPLQSWLDLLAAGVKPDEVRLLGVNGGNVAGLEYRIALALGAQVGIVQDSGREADRLGREWPANPTTSSPRAAVGGRYPASRPDSPVPGRLFVLPSDPMTLRALVFMGTPAEPQLAPEAVEQAARLTHQDFLEEKRYEHSDPVMKPWPKLRTDLRQSNLDQIRYLESILNASGFAIREIAGNARDPKFSPGEVKCMAEMEHGRWNVERLASGWQYGPEKDAEKKISPWLVSWNALPPGIRHYDLQNVKLWPQTLAEIGYEIYRLRRTGTPGKAPV